MAKRVLRVVLRIIYGLSWATVFAIFVFALASVAAEILQRQQVAYFQDDDWALYVWPIGVVAGWWFARRSMRWHTFHCWCIPISIVALGCSIWQMIDWYRMSEAARGTGPFAGLGEVLVAGLWLVFAVICTLILSGSVAMVIHGRIEYERYGNMPIWPRSESRSRTLPGG